MAVIQTKYAVVRFLKFRLSFKCSAHESLIKYFARGKPNDL